MAVVRNDDAQQKCAEDRMNADRFGRQCREQQRGEDECDSRRTEPLAIGPANESHSQRPDQQ